jgi:cytoskeletal protein CcmA (bactofilin family)
MQDKNTITIIDENSVIRGNIHCSNNLRVNGRIVGNILAFGKVVIGINGFVEGNIMADELEIIGEVIGKIKIKNTLSLKSSACVLGDVETAFLVIEKGAKYMGGCKMELNMANAIYEQPSEDIKVLNGTED